MRIELSFTCKYRIKFAPHYIFTTKQNLLVNLKTGRIISQIMKGGSIGYVVEGKFHSLSKLKSQLELIPKNEELPF